MVPLSFREILISILMDAEIFIRILNNQTKVYPSVVTYADVMYILAFCGTCQLKFLPKYDIAVTDNKTVLHVPLKVELKQCLIKYKPPINTKYCKNSSMTLYL